MTFFGHALLFFVAGFLGYLRIVSPGHAFGTFFFITVFIAVFITVFFAPLHLGRRSAKEAGHKKGRSDRSTDQRDRTGGEHHKEQQLGFLARRIIPTWRCSSIRSLLLVIFFF